ncbi:MAG: sigma-70 family RNA polymerase sigma factor [Chloroflexi bacterium]|nr:sigma-70 family RNA polymerase sigma factor [Chloroflexota bacterium]
MAKPDPKILEWVEAALADDQDAFAELVYLFQDPVYNLCYRMLGDAGEAEDATQEAFLRAFLNLRRYDTKRSFKTWLMSIASNHCIDRWRKRRMQLVSLDDEPTAAALALSSSDPLPEQAALSAEQSELLQGLLMKLEESYRLPLILRYWYDYSYAEIAQLMETTESAIKSRLFRARRTLADLLSDRDARASGVKDDEDDRFDRLATPKPKGN